MNTFNKNTVQSPAYGTLLKKCLSFRRKSLMQLQDSKKYECHFCNIYRIEGHQETVDLVAICFNLKKLGRQGSVQQKAESLLSDHFCRQANGSVINLK
ncbi:hypothetical protein T10_3975 [Trichinella papuae]|uniref:Uncharacterized protein n=1 Tax=Trichinella papuae TaxID=268474 RepID=A0A0V1MJM3_9BILA|nr:hypothetical protein T10_3975 [Trichinella papuae]